MTESFAWPRNEHEQLLAFRVGDGGAAPPSPALVAGSETAGEPDAVPEADACCPSADATGGVHPFFAAEAARRAAMAMAAAVTSPTLVCARHGTYHPLTTIAVFYTRTCSAAICFWPRSERLAAFMRI